MKYAIFKTFLVSQVFFTVINMDKILINYIPSRKKSKQRGEAEMVPVLSAVVVAGVMYYISTVFINGFGF